VAIICVMNGLISVKRRFEKKIVVPAKAGTQHPRANK
jgi:hypothetical protein